MTKMSVPDSSALFEIAYFTCKESQSRGFLKSKYFKNFIDCKLRRESSSVVEFFGNSYPSASCMWINMHHLFLEIKRNFFIMKGMATDSTSSLKSDYNFISVENLRMDILKVLQFFLSNLQELSTKYSGFTDLNTPSKDKRVSSMLILLLTEIKSLLLFVGHISNILGINNIRDFSSDTSKTASYFYHYYHLCLDIWFISIAIVYSICILDPEEINIIDDLFCDSSDQSNPFLQLTSLVLYEFTCLALNRNQHAKNSPFSCPCIRDFWIILIYLFEKCEIIVKETSFWCFYQSVLQKVLKNTASLPSNEEISIHKLSIVNIQFNKENVIEACFWIISHIAPLYKYNYFGEFCSYIKPKSGYVILKNLIDNLLCNSPEASEKNLRNIMLYCIPLASIWEVRGEILLPFTDFFIKKIEETFCVQSNQLTGLSYLFKDSSSWLTYISNLSNDNVTGRDTSFDRFLHILHLQVKQDADSSLWRTLKGRIYCKYFPKKLKEMSEIGLQNTFSLLLAIAASDQFEIGSKICEIVSIVERTSHQRKQIISWKAVFVLLHVCLEKKQITQNIVTLISTSFNHACNNYSKCSNDSMHKNNIMNLLLIYIDNMNEIFKRDLTDLSVCQLITEGFAVLLSLCSISEINYILGVFDDILKNILKAGESDKITNEALNIKIVEAIFSNVYPFVESISITDTPPIVISEIALSLTRIVFNASSGFNCFPHDFNEIFMHFGIRENVNCAISSQYMSSIMVCSDIMSELRLKTEDLDCTVLQSWLKCTIYKHTKCEYMKTFTEKVLESNLMNIIPGFKIFHKDVSDHVQASIEIYQFLGQTYDKFTLQQKIQMAHKIQQVFKNYASYAANKIKKAEDSDCFAHVYKLISHLVENCSILLHHHVTTNHLLLEILDKTIYPQILFPKDKILQSQVSCSVKEYLPNILRGLFKLEYRKDKSVEREIRDITIYCLGAFPQSNSPIVKWVIDSITTKSEGLSMDAYQFLLEALKSSFLSNNVEKPDCILEFYQEIFRQTPQSCKKDITNVLLKCALEVFMKRNDSVSESLKIVVKKTLMYFKDKMPYSSAKTILMPVIQWFVLEKLQWSVMRGFSILDVFVEHMPQLISEMMPFLTKSVETLEKNRGIGEDMLLRGGLRNLVIKLQQKLCT